MAGYTGNSIVDFLKSTGGDSSYGARKKRAAELGITGYGGTAEQNTQLLNMLRNPAPSVKTVTAPAANKPAAITPVASAVPAAVDNPILDSNGNAYVIGSNGFSTVGKGANGSYLLSNGERYATADEAAKIKDASSKPLTPDIMKGITGSGGSNSPKSFFDTAVDKLSPIRQKINELLTGILGTSSQVYNPAADTDYQTYKADMLKQADTAYSNVNADYLGNQGGNFNSAAQQIASTAKNDLVNKAELAQGDFADRFNTNQRNKMNDSMGLVNQLLGIDEANTSATDKALQKQVDTIGQYYSDYTAEINKREAADPNDPLIPYLKQAREDKKASMAATQTSAGKQAYDNAMAMWKASGTATPEIAKILGIPNGAKTADYDISKMNAETSRMNAGTSRINANKSSGDKGTLTNSQIFSQAKDLISEKVPSGETDADGKQIMRPKYTKAEFEKWLANMFPMTPEGDKAYDDIVAAINLDSIDFYDPATAPRQNVPAYLVNK